MITSMITIQLKVDLQVFCIDGWPSQSFLPVGSRNPSPTLHLAHLNVQLYYTRLMKSQGPPKQKMFAYMIGKVPSVIGKNKTIRLVVIFSAQQRTLVPLNSPRLGGIPPM